MTSKLAPGTAGVTPKASVVRQYLKLFKQPHIPSSDDRQSTTRSSGFKHCLAAG